MKILKELKGAYLAWKIDRAKRGALARALDESIKVEIFPASTSNPTEYYLRCFQEFNRSLPSVLRRHREYFTQHARGFGEDAFHVMWWQLIQRFKPASFLEIGVYRGQTASLVSLISKIENLSCRVTGISPFASVGDSVSNYLTGLDYLADTYANFAHFDLPKPELVKAYSTDPEALAVIAGTAWDCIYIDGNHDYEIVKRDWEACSEAVRTGGLIVLDDSGLSTTYQPPLFATGGHPGPSRLAAEIDRARFEEILQVGHNRVFKKLV